MDNIDKLKHLLEHWIEHNEEHAANYLLWADKAKDFEKPELEAILREIAGETKRLDDLFKLALKECD